MVRHSIWLGIITALSVNVGLLKAADFTLVSEVDGVTVKVDGKLCITSGSAFIAANATRSLAVQRRNSKRCVVIV